MNAKLSPMVALALVAALFCVAVSAGSLPENSKPATGKAITTVDITYPNGTRTHEEYVQEGARGGIQVAKFSSFAIISKCADKSLNFDVTYPNGTQRHEVHVEFRADNEADSECEDEALQYIPAAAQVVLEESAKSQE